MEFEISNGEVKEKYECMRFSPETIIYENVYDGEVNENNGAYFFYVSFSTNKVVNSECSIKTHIIMWIILWVNIFVI